MVEVLGRRASASGEQLMVIHVSCAHNYHALVPVGDFMLQTAGWTHRDPATLFAVLDGYSPSSNVSPPVANPVFIAAFSTQALATFALGSITASILLTLLVDDAGGGAGTMLAFCTVALLLGLLTACKLPGLRAGGVLAFSGARGPTD